jgi:hypothetical protein
LHNGIHFLRRRAILRQILYIPDQISRPKMISFLIFHMFQKTADVRVLTAPLASLLTHNLATDS